MSNEPIGRVITVVILGDLDRDHPIEDAIADAALDGGIKHDLRVTVVSGRYYSDGDERDRELAKVTADRDRLASMYEAATLVLALHLNNNCTTVAQVRSRAASKSAEERAAMDFIQASVDSPKMIRETLCVAQTHVGLSGDYRATEHVQRLQRLIDVCDTHRPLGPDGKHGDRHTPTCGCSR